MNRECVSSEVQHNDGQPGKPPDCPPEYIEPGAGGVVFTPEEIKMAPRYSRHYDDNRNNHLLWGLGFARWG